MRRTTGFRAVAFAIIAFATCPQAHAQEPDPIPFRMVSDPAFLPLQGQFYGMAAYTYSESDADRLDSTGAKLATVKDFQNQIAQTIQYGITDDLTLDLSDAYSPSNRRKTVFTTGGFVDRDASGFSDPGFGLTWRALDQMAGSSFNFDLLADYRANAIAARSDNEARGGQSTNFGLALSHAGPMFTIYGKALAEWYDRSAVFNPAVPDFVRTGSHRNYLLALQTQTRLSPLFSIDAGANYTFAGDARIVNVTSGIDHLSQAGDGLGLNAAFNYDIVPNAIVSSLTYAYRRDNSSKELFAAPTLDTSLHNRNDNTFGVKFDYLIP